MANGKTYEQITETTEAAIRLAFDPANISNAKVLSYRKGTAVGMLILWSDLVFDLDTHGPAKMAKQDEFETLIETLEKEVRRKLRRPRTTKT